MPSYYGIGAKTRKSVQKLKKSFVDSVGTNSTAMSSGIGFDAGYKASSSVGAFKSKKSWSAIQERKAIAERAYKDDRNDRGPY